MACVVGFVVGSAIRAGVVSISVVAGFVELNFVLAPGRALDGESEMMAVVDLDDERARAMLVVGIIVLVMLVVVCNAVITRALLCGG